MDCFEQNIRITKKDYRMVSNILKEWLETKNGVDNNQVDDKHLNGRIKILKKYFMEKGI